MTQPRLVIVGGTGAVSRSGVVVAGGRVVALDGDPARSDVVWQLPPGAVVTTAFRDPHVHLLAMAAQRLSVDVGWERAADIPALLAVLGAAAAGRPTGDWIRATGYDEAFLADRRHPTLDELDRAVGDRRLVLRHRSGHLALLNRAALHAVGLDADDGLVVGPAALDGVAPRLDPGELRRSLLVVGADLAAAGVVGVTDASATNDLDRLGFLVDAFVGRRPGLDVSALPAADHIAEVVAAGLEFGGLLRGASGGADGGVRLGQAKVMPDHGDVAGSIARQVAVARGHGWPVAVHAVDIEEVEGALSAIERSGPPRWGSDRIEHLGVALDEQVERVARAGIVVVTQPAFVTHRGRKYVEEVSTLEQPWLYRVGSLLRAGIVVAASSDAPVVPARPLEAVAAAIDRRPVGLGGAVLGPHERVDRATALRLVGEAAAGVDGSGGGPLAVGRPADLVVLDADPLDPAVAPETVKVLATMRRGHVLHTAPELDVPRWPDAG